MKTYKQIREENTRPTEGLLPEDEPVTVGGAWHRSRGRSIGLHVVNDDNGRRWVVPIYWNNGQAVSSEIAYSPELNAALHEAEEGPYNYEHGEEADCEAFIELVFANLAKAAGL